jgi:hypothetical protein
MVDIFLKPNFIESLEQVELRKLFLFIFLSEPEF